MFETTKNIRRNPNVALSVWNTGWKKNCVGYELRGTAKYFKKGKYYEAVKRIPENKGEPLKGAVVATIKKIKRLS